MQKYHTRSEETPTFTHKTYDPQQPCDLHIQLQNIFCYHKNIQKWIVDHKIDFVQVFYRWYGDSIA